jgi:hypothetical protein
MEYDENVVAMVENGATVINASAPLDDGEVARLRATAGWVLAVLEPHDNAGPVTMHVEDAIRIVDLAALALRLLPAEDR